MWGLALSFLAWVGLNPLPFMAGLIYTTEPALKLIISILMSYPLAIGYHMYVRKHVQYRNWFFFAAGADMAFFNFGISMYHNVVPIIVIFASNKVLGPGKNNAIFSLVFNMSYLLVGYIVTESEDYDITWTMSHCVLTLKLIALTFDLWDGEKLARGDEDLSANNKKSAVIQPPTFEELLGFVFFPASFLVGPIFSFKRYKDYISDKYPLDAEAKVYEEDSKKRLIQGFGYLAAFQIGVSVFNIQYMMSDEFTENSIFYRHFYCGLWGHFALYKYISCWLLTEASCIRFGLSYNGQQSGDRGQAVSLWDGCNNIKPYRFESATKFQHYIESFNCNTNHFAAEYVYKRLRFLGNRNYSQVLTLLFLAVWHGTQSGYYATFFNEFIIVVMERDLEAILSKTQLYHDIWSNRYGRYAMHVILKAYTIVFMGWSLVPITLKTFSKWWGVYASLWFSGYLLLVPWAFAYKPLLILAIKKYKITPAQKTDKTASSQSAAPYRQNLLGVDSNKQE